MADHHSSVNGLRNLEARSYVGTDSDVDSDVQLVRGWVFYLVGHVCHDSILSAFVKG
jgi:hypothetical protein